MDTNAITSSSTASAAASGTEKDALTLDTQEFMELMIVELTNQDPFEPMKNQDLLNQMSTIQQLQSDQEMANSFEKMMQQYDSLLMRQELNTASGMIGQLVSGTTPDGSYAMGRVSSVSLDGEKIMLQIDTGQQINIKNMERLGGMNSQEIIGRMIIGVDEAGRRIVGKVNEVEVNDEQVLLRVQVAGQEEPSIVSLNNASIIDHDTADLLIGYRATDIHGTLGTVDSVKWTGQSESGLGVVLNVSNDDGEFEMPLDEVISIY